MFAVCDAHNPPQTDVLPLCRCSTMPSCSAHGLYAAHLQISFSQLGTVALSEASSLLNVSTGAYHATLHWGWYSCLDNVVWIGTGNHRCYWLV